MGSSRMEEWGIRRENRKSLMDAIPALAGVASLESRNDDHYLMFETVQYIEDMRNNGEDENEVWQSMANLAVLEG